MSKIICEVCGTSYSDAATQCPICGSVRPIDVQSVSDEADFAVPTTQYQYVKGGRFSKSNVRKRNNQNKKETTPKKSAEKKEKGSNRGLVVVILILLLAIIAVVAYIVCTYFLPVFWNDKDTGAITPDTKPSVTASPDVPCTQIVLDKLALTFEGTGANHQLVATLTPVDTTDTLTYTSGDESVATVDSSGLITAVNFGETVITVACGDITAQCKVSVNEPAAEFVLNRDDITFNAVGEEWLVYSGTISQTEITWASDDEAVATVENGRVVAVGPGVTTIYADYSGRIVSCIVRCDFEIPTEATEEVTVPEETQDLSQYTPPFRLKNLFSPYDNDVIISVGESFTLVLIDAYGNRISGVTWSVEDSNCCTVKDGTVTGVATGYTNVVATLNGEKYTCLVRVK